MSQWKSWVAILLGILLLGASANGISAVAQDEPAAKIDFAKARQLLQRVRNGESLTADERAYLEQAREQRRSQARGGQQRGDAARESQASTGLVPLTDMSKDDRYQGEAGGLYGAGRNEPPDAHRLAAESELKQVVPRNVDGQPAADGRIVLVSISMSNATQEFSLFKRLADADPTKSPKLTIVDCAQGGQAMAQWASPQARPWSVAEQRLAAAGVSNQQVQVAWVKLANVRPSGDLKEHGRKLYDDTLRVLEIARQRFPNLRVVYLASRIYGGYATTSLNPEPYAYESAFVVRWLIRDQMAGEKALQWDAQRGEVKVPLLLWGPYLWADGTKGRGVDDLVWERKDLAGDGTHPSASGREKVAHQLLDFFKQNRLAKSWFVAAPGAG